MIIETIKAEGLSQLSYLVGSNGVAAVIDRSATAKPISSVPVHVAYRSAMFSRPIAMRISSPGQLYWPN